MAPPHETLARTCTCQIHGVVDKAWAIIDHLEGKARNYIINKSEPERNDPGKNFFTLLSSRFGSGGNKMHVRQTLISRDQQEKED